MFLQKTAWNTERDLSKVEENDGKVKRGEGERAKGEA